MGPRRLWIALLLAALQYTGVHAGACVSAPDPDGVCPKNQATGFDCKDRNTKVDKSCPAGNYEKFLSIDGNKKWEKVTKIECDADTNWKATFSGGQRKLIAQDKVVCAKSSPIHSCKAKDTLKIGPCTGLEAWGCEKITLVDDVILSCTGTKSVFIKSGLAQWAPASTIKCDTDNGQWQGAAPNAQVVCADSPPNEKSCMAVSTLSSSCDPTLSATVECESVQFNDDSPPKCTSPKKLYYKSGSKPWTPTDVASCDKTTGNWIDAALNSFLIQYDVVICALGDPTAGSCDATLFASCSKYSSTIIDCVNPNPSCPAAQSKLYYKMAPSAPGTEMKWMLANSIKCVDAKWMVEYNYGNRPSAVQLKTKEDVLDLNNARVICTAADQDAKVCDYDALMTFEEKNLYTVMAPQPAPAGAAGECISPSPSVHDADMDIYSADGQTLSKDMMQGGTYPICRPDGNWEWIKTESGIEKNHIMGKKIVCRIKKCNMCQLTNLPDVRSSTLIDVLRGKTSAPGQCNSVNCPTSDHRLAIQKTTESKMRYYTGNVNCDNDGVTWKDDEGVPVTEAVCIQRLYCHDPASMMIDYACPTEMPDCQQIGMPAPGDKTASVVWEKLKCPTPGYKILIRPNTGATSSTWDDPNAPWDDVKSINCDQNTGKWHIEFPEGPSEQRDDKNTVICAKENSNKRTTTTTTTTTPAPALPICELCEKKKPANITECEQCDSSNLKFSEFTEDKCKINAADGNKLVINMMEDVEAIYCSRTDKYDENVKWTKTDDTTEVLKISARSESKRDSWKTWSYVVVAVVFVTIGGMAIGCVVIYMRMRKKLSVREGKKERGVTKKLTSSNVVKTNNVKSSAATGSMEKGKSKEPAKSKMEEKDEDAPTLKI